MRHQHVLHRRTFLRGLGVGGAAVTVGLPRLGIMLNGNGTAYAAGTPLPRRYLTYFFGCGIIPPRWVPAKVGSGADWALSEQLTPLADFKKYLTVVSGLEVKVPPDGLQPHTRGPAAVFTGANPLPRSANGAAMTFDQVIANANAGATPFKSIEVGVTRATPGYGGTLADTVSLNGANAPNVPTYDAAALFTRLFGKAPASTTNDAAKAAAAASALKRQSVLDLVKADIDGLKPRLGAEDSRRLDQHLDGIHQLEKRISAMPAVGCTRPSVTYPATSSAQNAAAPPEVHAAMADLVAYALACDLTRVGTYMWSRPAAHVDFKVIGITKDIHDDISHVEPGDQPIMNTAILYVMNQLAVFLRRLQMTPDGAGNLLDNSAVLVTSEVGFGREHAVDEFPMVVVGKAGGALKGDTHVRSTTKETVTKVPFTLMNVLGANVKSWGDAQNGTSDGIGAMLA